MMLVEDHEPDRLPKRRALLVEPDNCVAGTALDLP
jgi:hypothetical protein